MANSGNPANRIPLSFDEALGKLLSVDPKKLPPAVQPATAKARPAKKPARKKAKGA